VPAPNRRTIATPSRAVVPGFLMLGEYAARSWYVGLFSDANPETKTLAGTAGGYPRHSCFTERS